MVLKAKQLVSLIEGIVQKKLEEMAPRLIEKTLSESYIKKLLGESGGRKEAPVKLGSRTSLKDLVGSEEDEDEESFPIDKDHEERIPQVQPNEHQGIYHGKMGQDMHESDGSKKQLRHTLARRMGIDVFEGVQAIPSDTGQPEAVSEEALMKGIDFERMSRLIETPSSANRVDQSEMQRKMKRLDEYRKSLDVPVNA